MKKPKEKKGQKGFIFITAVITMGVLLVLGGAHLTMTLSEQRLTMRNYREVLATNLAEAGVEMAIWELNYGGADFLSGEGWSGTDPTMTVTSFSDANGEIMGDFTVTVTNPISNNPVIEATGYTPNISSPLIQQERVRVGMRLAPFFDFAVFGDEGVEFGSNSGTDSYDSDLGAYGETNVAANGDIGTNSISNGAMDLASNIEINGDAVVGPGGDPNQVIETGSNAEITGTQTALGTEKDLPQMTPPSDLTNRGSISLGGNNTLTVSQSGQYSNITLNSNSTLIINASVTIYVTGTLSLNSNSQLNITNDSDVTFYVGGTIRMDSNTAINNTSQDPTKLSIYGTDSLTSIDFHSNTALYGAVYARNANVDIASNANIYGSVVANTVGLASNSFVHYDEALARETDGPTSSTLEVLNWQKM